MIKTTVQSKTTLSLGLACLISSHAVLAGDAGMQQWFNDMGMYANATPSGAFQGQTMNTYTGGGLYARAPQKSYQFANFDPPRLNAGCGGIDLYTGAFSFINSDQIVNLLRNAGSNALGYLFMTNMESICPSCTSAIKFLQDQSAKMNALNMNSCELASGVVDATASTIGLKTLGNDTKLYGKIAGIADDFTGAWQSTKETPSKANQVIQAKRNDASLPEGSKNRNVNLVWAALSDITRNGVPLTLEEKELAMSMVGTVIITDIPPGQTSVPEGAGQNVYIQPATVQFENFVEGDNGQLNVLKYNCGADTSKWGCIDLATGGLSTSVWPTGSSNKSFKAMVEATINRLMANIDARQNSASGNSDYALINSSTLPVWKMIATHSQLPASMMLSQEYIDMIATDIAYQYYTEGLRAVNAALASANGKSGNPLAATAIKELLDGLKGKQATAVAIVQKKYTSGMAVSALNEQIRALEISLRNRVNAYNAPRAGQLGQ